MNITPTGVDVQGVRVSQDCSLDLFIEISGLSSQELSISTAEHSRSLGLALIFLAEFMEEQS